MKTYFEEYEKIKDKGVVLVRSEFEKNPDIINEKSVLIYAEQRPGVKFYEVAGNVNNLTDLELAIIADSGNLCFGYRKENKDIYIYTD